MNKRQDTLTYVSHYGKPSLFVTFTCNERWPEIRNKVYVNHGKTHRYRKDITTLVFREKFRILYDLLGKKNMYGPLHAIVAATEFQKRGPP